SIGIAVRLLAQSGIGPGGGRVVAVIILGGSEELGALVGDGFCGSLLVFGHLADRFGDRLVALNPLLAGREVGRGPFDIFVRLTLGVRALGIFCRRVARRIFGARLRVAQRCQGRRIDFGRLIRQLSGVTSLLRQLPFAVGGELVARLLKLLGGIL